MPIIPNIATAKNYLGANYTNTTLPPMRKAETELRRVLGKPLFDAVQASITAGTETGLTQLCQECVALYAYWLHLPDVMVQVGDKGLSVPVTDNNVQPARWQFREKRSALEGKYMQAVEDLLTYLFAEGPTTWQKPELYTGRTIKTGAQFSKYYPLRQPEAVFMQLLPIVAEVEETYIAKAIGAEQLAAMVASSDPALWWVTRAVANFTIREATSKLSCQLGADGFTVLMNPPDDPQAGRQNAPLPQIAAAGYNAEKAAEGFLNDLVKLLNAQAKPTGPYSLYYNSPLYKDPTIETTSPNAFRQGVFGL